MLELACTACHPATPGLRPGDRIRFLAGPGGLELRLPVTAAVLRDTARAVAAGALAITDPGGPGEAILAIVEVEIAALLALAASGGLDAVLGAA